MSINFENENLINFTFFSFSNEIVFEKNLMKCIIELQNPSFKGVVIFDEASLKMLNYHRKDKLQLNTIDQKIVSYNLGYCLVEDKFITQIYLKKMAQLRDGGFLGRIDPPANEDEPDNRVVLTLDHLGVGFSIWCLLLLVALFVFGAERILSKARKLLKIN